MNRTTRWALVVLGFQLSWPLAFAQPLGSRPEDAIAGARVFRVKGCAACHTATRAGPPAAPDLRHAAAPRSLDEIARAMWNHRLDAQQFRRSEGRLDASEARDLLAFLFRLDYWDGGSDGDGDAKAGRQLFTEKKCAICHQAGGTGGVVGPRLDRFKDYHSPILLAAIMWNHGPQMVEAMRVRGIERPLFRDTELRDLIAYLKAESVAAEPGPLYLLPGDPEQGRQIFAETRCMECHGSGGPGGSLVGRGVRRNLSQFAAAMWNKAPVMMLANKRRGIAISTLRGDQMADLVAYLDAVGYFADPGDAKRGQQLAADPGCVGCHSAHGLGAPGREIIWPHGLEASTTVISVAWNHALIGERAAGQAKAAWRPLGAREMADLLAFVRSLGREGVRDGRPPTTIQGP